MRTLLGDPASLQDESDQRHLARAIASSAEVFVTRDQPLLDNADEVYDRHGLSVVRPSQLVSRYEELRNERDYQRNRLVGTDLQIQRLSTDSGDLVAPFRLESEKEWELGRILNTAFAHPDRYDCRYIATSDGKPLALYVLERSDTSTLSVPVFRISRRALQTRMAGTLARTLLTEIVQAALNRGECFVRFAEPDPNSTIVDALQDRGFIAFRDGWLKLSMASAVHHCDLPHRLQATLVHADSMSLPFRVC